MSDTGLLWGTYEQIRRHAELVDRVLLKAKGGAALSADPDGARLAALLEELGTPAPTSPSARLICLFLRGRSVACTAGWAEAASAIRVARSISPSVVQQLELLAQVLDEERAETQAKMRGVRR